MAYFKCKYTPQWSVFHRLNHSAAERPEDKQQKLMYVQNSNAKKIVIIINVQIAQPTRG